MTRGTVRMVLAAVVALGGVGLANAQQFTPSPSAPAESRAGTNGTVGSMKQQPRGTPETTGSLGAVQPGQAETEREKRAQQRSARATKGICNGC